MNTELQTEPRELHAASIDRHAPADEREALPLHAHHARGIGIGYGNSSGYGATLHFFDGHADPIFRLDW